MNKFQTLILLAALSLASCQSEAPESALAEGKVTVELSALLNGATLSRADDAAVTRCLVQLIDQDRTNPDDQGPITLTGSQSAGFNGDITIYKDHTYDILYWADCGEDYYTATDLTAVALAAEKDASIAYTGRQSSWQYSAANSTISTTLIHAVAKVSIKTTKAVTSLIGVTVKGVKVASGYDCKTSSITGATSAKTDGYSTSIASAAADEEVLSFYALVDGTNQTITVQFGEEDPIEVTNVPIQAQTHTILSGDLSGSVATTFNVTVNTNWVEQSSSL